MSSRPETDNFRVQIIGDVHGVSLCGALKSKSHPSFEALMNTVLIRCCVLDIVAVAAGFMDGLQWGDNAKGESIHLPVRRSVLIIGETSSRNHA